MNQTHRFALATLLAVVLLPVAHARAWEPGGADLDKAIAEGTFAAYQESASAFLAAKAAGKTDQAALGALIEDPQVRAAIDQRQLIAKCGADKLVAFAKADPANPAFLGWLMKDTAALDQLLEGCVPLHLNAREQNNYSINTDILDRLRKIKAADPELKDGLYLRVAIATAIAPPGSGAPGAGQGKTVDPVDRYKHFKEAHKNKELVPSFDDLTVWELQKVVQSGASNEDLAWGRQMIRDWRPDLLIDEAVVNSTSFVWRRNAPPQFYPFKGMKDVLAGGGKCGPRSSWSVFICQACGVPAAGVGQPAHACVAYKSANPMVEPQPGSHWKVGFGRGWQVSKLEGMSGPEFIAAVEDRAHRKEFSQVEHLRWLAAALPAADQATPIMDVAHAIQKSLTAAKTDLTASLKAEEAEADPGAVKAAAEAKPVAAKLDPTKPQVTEPVVAKDGKIHVEAGNYAATGGQISWGGQSPHVLLHDSPDGGKQIFFQQQMVSQWADYVVDVPESGTYEVVMKAACVNEGQDLEVCLGSVVLAKVPIALTHGIWQETAPVEIKLEKGVQTLRVQTPTTEHRRGIALRWFELKRKG